MKATNLLLCPKYQAIVAMAIADPAGPINEPRQSSATLLRHRRSALNHNASLCAAAESLAASLQQQTAQMQARIVGMSEYLSRPAFHQLVSELERSTGFQFWQLFLERSGRGGHNLNRIKCRVVARRKWWEQMRLAGMSFPEIGTATGVSHTTVLEALKLPAHTGRI